MSRTDEPGENRDDTKIVVAAATVYSPLFVKMDKEGEGELVAILREAARGPTAPKNIDVVVSDAETAALVETEIAKDGKSRACDMRIVAAKAWKPRTVKKRGRSIDMLLVHEVDDATIARTGGLQEAIDETRISIRLTRRRRLKEKAFDFDLTLKKGLPPKTNFLCHPTSAFRDYAPGKASKAPSAAKIVAMGREEPRMGVEIAAYRGEVYARSHGDNNDGEGLRSLFSDIGIMDEPLMMDWRDGTLRVGLHHRFDDHDGSEEDGAPIPMTKERLAVMRKAADDLAGAVMRIPGLAEATKTGRVFVTLLCGPIGNDDEFCYSF